MTLARELLKLSKGETLGYAIGIVTDDSPLTVQINGDTVDIIDPPLLGGIPTIGTPVFVLRPGPAIVVVGTIGTSTFTPDPGESYFADSVSGAVTVDYANAKVNKYTLTGNVTFTFTGATTGFACGLTLYLVQDGTGSRTVTWPASVKWAFGSVPTLSTAANSVDIVIFETYDGGTSWWANLAGKAYA